MPWGIHTVYVPRENLRFIEEWIQYHLLIGAEYFYLYDNTGSRQIDEGHSIAVDGTNKHGIEVDPSLSDGEIAEIEAAIFKKYPVTKVKWQPVKNGQIVYGQVEACDHFAETSPPGWCAFIDIDEFIYSPYDVADLMNGQALILLQQCFQSRFDFDTALEITGTFPFDTRRWGRKLLINMDHYIPGSDNIHDLNFNHYQPAPFENLKALRINHYNHGRIPHVFLDHWHASLDPTWVKVPYEQVFTEQCSLLKNRAKKIDYSGFVKEALRR